MKKLLCLLLLICVSISSYSQQIPPPTNVIATVNKISGNADPKTTVFIERNENGTINTYTIVVNYKGYFEHIFNPVLTPVSKLLIQTIDEAGNKLNPALPVNIQTPELILDKLSKGEIKLPVNTPPVPEPAAAAPQPSKADLEQSMTDIKNQIELEKEKLKLQRKINKNERFVDRNFKTDSQRLIDEKKLQNEIQAVKDEFAGKTVLYKSRIWSTNFSLPLVRFNLVNSDDTKEGDVLLFNSIGAGIGYYWGRLERTRDADGEIVNEEFSNTFGLTAGALFSAGTGSDVKNVFAPVINFSALDFQIGAGYELGNMAAGQNRLFLTVSYGIPLFKLSKKGYRISKNGLTLIEVIHKTKDK